jgi:hypothetical protein
METRSLIHTLVTDLRPVTPLPVPSVRLVRWGVAATTYGVAAVVAIGLRSDLSTAALTMPFVGHAALLLAASVTSAAAALSLAIPGERVPRWIRSAPGVAIAAWWAWLAIELMTHAAASGDVWRIGPAWGCVAKAFAVGLVPGAALTAMVGRGAMPRSLPAVTFVALCGVAVGALGVELTCPIVNPMHQLLWHAAPGLAVLLAIAGYVAVITAADRDPIRR